MDLKTFGEEVYGTKRVRTLKYNRISTFSGCNSREDKCVENNNLEPKREGQEGLMLGGRTELGLGEKGGPG